MSRFLQLREERVKQRQAMSDYYNDLQGVAGAIRQGFEDYLELPESTYLDDKREDAQYVQAHRRCSRRAREAHSLC